MVGNAHIDPMWIWDWGEGMHEVVQTFRAACDRLDEDPDLSFTASSACYYWWVERVAPGLFDRVRNHVRSGRWIVTGGQWIEPDCNLPSGESVCRQFLYGQRYLRDRVGVTATVGYNIDSFGHAGTLPQLLASSGIGSYVMTRPGAHEKEIASPAFTWVGTDGTSLPAYRIPYDYSTRGDTEGEVISERAGELLQRSLELGYPLMAFFGVGDHGGGPTRLAMRTIHRLFDETGGAVAFGDPARYFEDLGQSLAVGDKGIPVVAGELQWHAVGCYSARAHLKRANAQAEVMLVAAETMAEVCRALTGRDLDVQGELAEAWRGVLFAQFHDSLGGTCTERANEAGERLLAAGAARADQVRTAAAHSIAEFVDTWTEGAEAAEGIESAMAGLPTPMIVFNPLSWAVTGTVSVPHPVAVATSAGGERGLVQQVPSGEVTYSPTRSLVQVEVPALGYHRYWLHIFDPEPAPPLPSMVAAVDPVGVLDNGLVRVTVDRERGTVCGLTGAGGDRSWLCEPGIVPVLVDDDSDTWSHGLARYEGEERLGQLVGASIGEDGPVRASMRIAWQFGTSTVLEEVAVYRGQPYVEVRLDVDWHECGRVLKLVAPFDIDEPTSAAGAPYGFVERPCSGHEEPMVHWVDVSAGPAAPSPRTGGVTVTSPSAGGYDCAGARLRLTALRSPRVADHGMGWGRDDPIGYPATDHGRHRISYRLHPHAGTWGDADAARMAAEHRVELPVVLDTWHHGVLLGRASALRVEGEGVEVAVVKRAEDGGGTVLRLWERRGRAAPVTLDLDAWGRSWSETLRAHEVRSLLVPDDPSVPVREIDVPELTGAAARARP
jgi:alpha-mannosidase